MSQYIRFCADRLLHELKQPTINNITNPFPWMDMISLQSKTNIFEKQVGEYAKSGVNSASNPKHTYSSLMNSSKCMMLQVLIYVPLSIFISLLFKLVLDVWTWNGPYFWRFQMPDISIAIFYPGSVETLNLLGAIY